MAALVAARRGACVKPFGRGLVVGKFSPLHRGHELLVDTALDACEELLVLSYSKPEFPRCNATTRERWLEARYPRARFPNLRAIVLDDDILAVLCRDAGIAPAAVLPLNDAPDEAHRQFCAWVCQHLLEARADVVFTSEDYGDGFAATLGRRWYGDENAVRHVMVDRERLQVPVSGSQVRLDPRRHRHWLAPEVYESFVTRIGLVGGESSGKTTLAQALAAELQTIWVPEFGREYWVERGGRLEYGDFLHIARMQRQRELQMVVDAHAYLICDTTPLTTLSYCLADHGTAHSALRELAEAVYDYTIWCQPDFDHVQDGTRRSPRFTDAQHLWYAEYFALSGRTPIIAQGSVEDRVKTVLHALRARRG
jgi:HTH-type transcriptional repressor of NAD biosynthesis genes